MVDGRIDSSGAIENLESKWGRINSGERVEITDEELSRAEESVRELERWDIVSLVDLFRSVKGGESA